MRSGYTKEQKRTGYMIVKHKYLQWNVFLVCAHIIVSMHAKCVRGFGGDETCGNANWNCCRHTHTQAHILMLLSVMLGWLWLPAKAITITHIAFVHRLPKECPRNKAKNPQVLNRLQ